MLDQGKRVNENLDPIDGMHQLFTMQLSDMDAKNRPENYLKSSHIKDIYTAGMPFKKFVQNLRKAKLMDYTKLMNHVCLWSIRGVTGELIYNEDKSMSTMANQYFQFWFKEYLDGLAHYLLTNYGKQLVLEVGAGNGELTRGLVERGVNIIATDNGQWMKTGLPNNVRRMTYHKAVERYSPTVVISSWMPLNEDWTPCFRTWDSVREYILIGEIHGCCAAKESFDEYWDTTEGFDFDKYNVCKTDVLNLDSEVPEFMTMKHSWTFSQKR